MTARIGREPGPRISMRERCVSASARAYPQMLHPVPQVGKVHCAADSPELSFAGSQPQPLSGTARSTQSTSRVESESLDVPWQQENYSPYLHITSALQ